MPKLGCGRVLECLAELSERLLHGTPGRHVGPVLTIADGLDGNDNNKYQDDENAAGMHKCLQGAGGEGPTPLDVRMTCEGLPYSATPGCGLPDARISSL